MFASALIALFAAYPAVGSPLNKRLPMPPAGVNDTVILNYARE